MTKSELRKAIAAAVKNLSPTYCREADAAICRRVINSPAYQKARAIFCYVGTDREIDTTALLRSASRTARSWRCPCAPPPVSWRPGRSRASATWSAASTASWPPSSTAPWWSPGTSTWPSSPCCTGNARGQRLGYGGGYYDRYLPQLACPTMLLCRSRLVTEDIPTEDHDVPMAYLVTEEGITLCQKAR